MSKRCPGCGQINDDSRIFCSACGEPLDAQLRLIQDLEKQKKAPQKKSAAPRRDDDDDYVPPAPREKEKSLLPWIVLGLVVVADAAAWLLLK